MDLEAEALGVCLGCHECGQHRDCCPIENNRRGMCKSSLNKCYNCGQPTHRYDECNKPLKLHLASKSERRLRFLSKTSENDESKTLQVRNVEMSQLVIEESLVEANAVIYDIRNATKDFEIMEANSNGGEEVVSVKIQGTFREVGDARADTGADTSILSSKRHAKYLINEWEITGRPNYIRVADGYVHKVTRKGLVHAKINDIDLSIFETLIIDSEKWNFFLIGKDILVKKGLWNPRMKSSGLQPQN